MCKFDWPKGIVSAMDRSRYTGILTTMPIQLPNTYRTDQAFRLLIGDLGSMAEDFRTFSRRTIPCTFPRLVIDKALAPT